MILHIYFARRYLGSFLSVFAVFLILYSLLEMMEQFRRYNPANMTVNDVFALTALALPGGLYKILPLMVILATLVLFLSLARSSELVVTRAAGRSALRSLMAPVFTAFAIGAIGVAVVNPIVAATTKKYDSVSKELYGGNRSVMSVSKEGLWLRQGSETGQIVIRAERSNLDGTTLFNASFIAFSNDGLPRLRQDAKQARLSDGTWIMQDVKQWDFENNRNPEQAALLFDELTIPSDLTADEIRDGFGVPSTVPIWELPAFIDRLERAGFSALRHRVWLSMELSLPVMLAAMVMMGAVFTMRHTRLGRTGVMVLLSLLLGFSIYFLRNFAQILGESGQIPVNLAAWAPPVAAILLSLGMLLHLEDG